MFELIAILGIAIIVWFLISKTNVVKNINDILSGKIGLSEEKQEIIKHIQEETWHHSPLIGEHKELFEKSGVPKKISYSYMPMPYTGEVDKTIYPNKIENKDFNPATHFP